MPTSIDCRPPSLIARESMKQTSVSTAQPTPKTRYLRGNRDSLGIPKKKLRKSAPASDIRATPAVAPRRSSSPRTRPTLMPQQTGAIMPTSVD